MPGNRYPRATLQQTAQTTGDFILSHKFNIEIEGITTGGVFQVDGIKFEHEPVQYKDGEENTMRTRPGKNKPARVTIKREFSKDATLRNWRQEVVNGATARKSISITVHNDAGKEAGRINLYHCWPISYTGPAMNSMSSGHKTESVELLVEDFDWK